MIISDIKSAESGFCIARLAENRHTFQEAKATIYIKQKPRRSLCEALW